MGKLVDFSDVQPVVDAYSTADIPAFAILHDKQLKFKFTGEDIDEGIEYLAKILEQMKAAGNYAVFTLCMYEDLGNQKIKSSTSYDQSFNFQLNKNDNASVGRVNNGLDYTALAVENAQLKMKLARLEEEDDSPEESQMEAMMGRIMDMPGVDTLIGAIAAKLTDVIGGIGGNSNTPPPDEVTVLDAEGKPFRMKRVAGIVGVEEQSRVAKAIDELSDTVKDVPELLEKLVRFAKKDPFKFKLYMTALRGMKY